MKIQATDFDAREWLVIDNRSGLQVPNVISVDDQANEVERFKIDEKGRLIPCGGELATVVEHCPRVVFDFARKRAHIHVDEGGVQE